MWRGYEYDHHRLTMLNSSQSSHHHQHQQQQQEVDLTLRLGFPNANNNPISCSDHHLHNYNINNHHTTTLQTHPQVCFSPSSQTTLFLLFASLPFSISPPLISISSGAFSKLHSSLCSILVQSL